MALYWLWWRQQGGRKDLECLSDEAIDRIHLFWAFNFSEDLLFCNSEFLEGKEDLRVGDKFLHLIIIKVSWFLFICNSSEKDRMYGNMIF